MSKHKELVKKVSKQAIVAVAMTAAAGVLYAGVYMYADSIEKKKADAESKLASDQTSLNNFRGQMDQSGAAEKRFAALMSEKTTQDFSMNNDGLLAWIKAASAHYRTNPPRLTRSVEKVTTKPELSSLNYTVSLRQPMKIEFQAVSDLHAFSLFDDLSKAAPGLIRIDAVQVKRKGDIKDEVVTGLRSGQYPLLTDAKIEFSWIGLVPKNTKPGGAPSAPPAP